MREYKRLKKIIDEAEQLITKQVRTTDPEFAGWYTKTVRFLAKKYGEDSIEVSQIGNIRFKPSSWSSTTENVVFIKHCVAGLEKAKAILSVFLEEIYEECLDSQSAIEVSSESEPKRTDNVSDYSKVFIVHGHNGELKESVARLVERQGVDAIILHEQANLGNTIIEKFEQNSDVGAAVCLFTADDLGRAKADSTDQKRARQNVVFEAGYFIGKLGRKNVVIIADSGVEIPSDMQGIVYSDSANWQFSVLKELKAIGYRIDYNKLG